MIRISRKADYAVYIMGCLAQVQGIGQRQGGSGETGKGTHDVVSAQEIAQKTHLSKALVANLLKDLTRAGLLESVRGLRGGYRLAQPPATISLAQILAAVEGPFTLVACAGETAVPHHRAPPVSHVLQAQDHNCSYSLFCPSRSPMRSLHERIARMLDDVKLPELCGAPLQPHLFPASRLTESKR